MAKVSSILSEANLRTAKEQILDEEKIVTYITLSKDLCIHVNEAKNLLKKVIEEIKINNGSAALNVSFIVSGLSHDNAGRTTVCSESDLESEKSAFKTVFFQHIYSVCNGSSQLDSSAFVSLHKFQDFPLCAGLIKGNSCVKRSSDEIGVLKSYSQSIEQKTQQTAVKKENKEVTQNGLKDNVVKLHDVKSEPVIKTEIPSPKKATSSISNGKTNAKNSAKASKGIAGFFSRANSVPSAKSNKETAQEKVVKLENKTEVKKETKLEEKKKNQLDMKKENQPEVKKDESMEVDEEVVPAKKVKINLETAKSNKKNSSLNQIKKNAKVDKKRKRVLHVSDSDSDDNDPFADEKPVNHESDDEIPPTPSTNTVKITSGILNPKKKRKVVDKTYTDEEGYILTRKEEVYESCSEDEIEIVKTEPTPMKQEKENVEQTNKVQKEISPKEKKAKNTKKKVSPPQKGKQPTLTSFFKKA